MKWTADKIEAACRTLIPGYNPWDRADGFHFDVATAQRVIDFSQECCTFTNSKWAGLPVVLQPWQVAFLANLFGWKRDDDNTRRYRKALLFIAKKAGKTELAAIIANYLLFCDGEPAPEIVSAAGNAEQAEKVFKAASAMIINEPELSRRAEVLTRAVRNTQNGGTYKVINAEAKTKHGGNLHAALIDELMAIASPGLPDALTSSMRARRQPLVLYTTTAGENPESICGEVYDYACKVRDGVVIDPEFLPVVFEVPKDADISKPEIWKLAQPNLGVTVPVAEYERDYREALAIPRKMHVFKQFSLNQWVEAATSWIGLEDWKKCAGEVDLAKLKGKRATIGIDLSSTTDTTAVVAAVEDENKIRVLPFIFIPKDNAAGRYLRQKRDRAPYLSWIDQGFITATEGNVVDYGAVEAKILELAKHFTLLECEADPFNATGLLENLTKAGVNVVTMRQGWSLAEATKETERLILTGALVHPNNPAFNWQVSCAAVKSDEHENHWLVKHRSTGRIDAAVAMIMAINALRFGAGKGAEQPIVYTEAPDIFFL
ncbi:MAG: terminase large subunit [Bacillota bacterium]